MPKKICIIGTTPTRHLAPFNDPSWEIWTIGPGGRDIPGHRWDRLFEVHGAGINHTWERGFGEYLDFLSHVKPPRKVVTIRPIKEMILDWGYQHGKTPEEVSKEITGPFAANVVLDKERLINKYGRMWISSTISYALAQAIEEGATDIGIYGIDMESGEEYVTQFAGARHLMDLAKFVGIGITVPAWCGLLRDPSPYPDRFETYEALWFQNRIAMLSGIVAQKTSEHETRKAELYRKEGAIRTLSDIAQNFEGKVKTESLEAIERLDKERNEQMIQQANLSAEISHFNGQLATCKLYMSHFVFNGEGGIKI